ncbi:flavodoxin domain-containing protein [Klenkia sp. LSe6-5]|uniref:Flavodoxin domain-containing protein n=1 Tax=Klenkia sesuvii TaxID=3103137 RepID=A0ABU8DTN3_9ACTN
MNEGRGPRVLVAVASRHGATAEMAGHLAVDLERTAAGQRLGLTAAVRLVEHDPDPAGFAAVVLGSSVYAGRWDQSARQWANRHLTLLRDRPVWLLSSGPVGSAPFPTDEAHDVDPIARQIGACGRRTFPGRLDPDRLGHGERALVRAMRAPIGDFRDRAALRSWADEIAEHLAATRVDGTRGARA